MLQTHTQQCVISCGRANDINFDLALVQRLVLYVVVKLVRSGACRCHGMKGTWFDIGKGNVYNVHKRTFTYISDMLAGYIIILNIDLLKHVKQIVIENTECSEVQNIFACLRNSCLSRRRAHLRHQLHNSTHAAMSQLFKSTAHTSVRMSHMNTSCNPHRSTS